MKKHEFMTRLANELHSPSSVCSASLRSQFPEGKPWALPRRCINQVFTKKRSRCLRGLFSWFSIDLTGSGRSRPGSA